MVLTLLSKKFFPKVQIQKQCKKTRKNFLNVGACLYHTKIIRVHGANKITPNNRMVLSCIRHAESAFNDHPTVKGKIEGYFSQVTDIDSDLSVKGTQQARELQKKIHGLNESALKDKRIDLRKAQLVITSPLTRALRTGLISLPIERGYQYVVKWEITEQVENTTDIGRSPKELIVKFPALRYSLSQLPDTWWWQHPLLKGEPVDPRRDADWLRRCNGLPPARESSENVKQRLRRFLDWLIPLQHNKNQPLRNVVMVSHSCTLKFFEQILLEFHNANLSHQPNITYFENTEVRSYEMPTYEEWQQHIEMYPLTSTFL